MDLRGAWRRVIRGLRAVLRLLARPDQAVRGRGDLVLRPYRGYGSPREVFLIGRVYRQPPPPEGPPASDVARALGDVGRLLRRRGVAGASLTARFAGEEQRVASDRDGYFRVHLRLREPPPADRVWHRLELEMHEPSPLRAEAELFIPPPGCRRVVVSDIDDTVMHTGVANKAVMLWRLFAQGAERRVAFPGMAAFLQALHAGASGSERNPMLYVSRAPWAIYEVLEAFFQAHAIPVGPLLFLREWGLTLQSPLPRRAKGHKLQLIRHMLELYDDLPFVLIGDSGQRDPEIYARVVRENPGRVQAVYIRNVSRDPGRLREIEALAEQVARAGSSLLLAADSLAMAEHALAHGLIAAEALAEVRGERAEQGAAPAQPTRVVHEADLAEALEEAAAPANLAVEPDEPPQGAPGDAKTPRAISSTSSGSTPKA